MPPDLLPPLVLICGGENSRLSTLQGTIYKPFLDLQGSTIVAKYVERARREGVTRIVVVTDERDSVISSLVAQMRVAVSESTRLTELLEPGKIGVKIASAAHELSADHVLVALGDTFAWYSFADLAGLMSDHDSGIVVAPHESRFGVVEVTGDRVTDFREKPTTTDLVNLGQLALGPVALRRLAEGLQLAELLAGLAAEGRLGFIRSRRREFLTLDSIPDVIAAEAHVREHGWD